jgi:hypothetical protein
MKAGITTIIVELSGDVLLLPVFTFMEIKYYAIPYKMNASECFRVIDGNGDIFGIKYAQRYRGIIRSEECLKNAITMDVAMPGHNVNLKLSKNKFQISGTCSLEHAEKATNYVLANILRIKAILKLVFDHPTQMDHVFLALIEITRGAKKVADKIEATCVSDQTGSDISMPVSDSISSQIESDTPISNTADDVLDQMEIDTYEFEVDRKPLIFDNKEDQMVFDWLYNLRLDYPSHLGFINMLENFKSLKNHSIAPDDLRINKCYTVMINYMSSLLMNIRRQALYECLCDFTNGGSDKSIFFEYDPLIQSHVIVHFANEDGEFVPNPNNMYPTKVQICRSGTIAFSGRDVKTMKKRYDLLIRIISLYRNTIIDKGPIDIIIKSETSKIYNRQNEVVGNNSLAKLRSRLASGFSKHEFRNYINESKDEYKNVKDKISETRRELDCDVDEINGDDVDDLFNGDEADDEIDF